MVNVSRLFTSENLTLLAKGLWVTIWLSVVGFVGGTILGAILFTPRLFHGRIAGAFRVLTIIYVEAMRRIPLLVLLLVVFFGLPLVGIDVSAVFSAAVGLVIFASAYMAENIRTGMEAVKKQQWEAAAALGLTTLQQLRYVVLPQALRVMIPPSVGFYVGLIKDTSIATIVGFTELTHAGVIIRYRIGESFIVFTTIMLLYFMICYPIAQLGRWTERRLSSGGRT